MRKTHSFSLCKAGNRPSFASSQACAGLISKNEAASCSENVMRLTRDGTAAVERSCSRVGSIMTSLTYLNLSFKQVRELVSGFESFGGIAATPQARLPLLRKSRHKFSARASQKLPNSLCCKTPSVCAPAASP